MSLLNSVIGTISPKFRSSFEDPRAREHELPLYKSPSGSPPIPPPIAATVLWNTPSTSFSAPPRVPDHLLILQRRARHLEQQLQELLDAQADGLMGGLGGNDSFQDDITSNGSVTPTVSSIRSGERTAEYEDNEHIPKKKKVGLNAARKGIFKRIQQLAVVKSEEMDMLDENLRDLQAILQKTESWSQKRNRLEKRINDIEGETNGARTKSLQEEASKLELEIRQKEEELWQLKTRHRRVLNQLSESENSVEAKLSSYKASLSILDKEIAGFLSRPPDTNHVPLAKSPFLSLPAKRRTLEMAHEYWQEEHNRLADKCQEVDIDRAALDEGAVLWENVVKRVADYEANLQAHMIQASRTKNPDHSKLLDQMDSTISYLEEKMELATSRNWNLLVCAIGAELEAFTQGKDLLEEALGIQRSDKGKKSVELVDMSSVQTESEDEGSNSAIRITSRSPPNPSSSSSSASPPPQPSGHKFFDTDNEDPDPELMISHQDSESPWAD